MAETIDNIDFPLARQKINAAITLLDSFNFGSEPSVKRAYMPWIDPTGKFYVRSGDNNSWILQGDVTQPSFGLKASNIAIDAVSGMTSSQLQQAISELQTNKVAKTRPNWTNLTLQNGFTAFGSGTATPAYRKLDSGLVQVKGLLKRSGSAPPATTIIAQLPASHYPSEIVHVPTVGAGIETSGFVNGAIFEVWTDGTLRYQGGGTSNYFVLSATYFQS